MANNTQRGFPGLLKTGVIQGNYSENDEFVNVTTRRDFSSPDDAQKTQFPVAYFSNTGGFIGGYPEAGTSVLLSQAEGGFWYINSSIARDINENSNTSSNKRLPLLKSGQVIFQASESAKILADKNKGLTLGGIKNNIILDSKRNINLNNFGLNIISSESEVLVSGAVKREKNPNRSTALSAKREPLLMDDSISLIGMDPSRSISASNLNSIKNPPFVEKRELIYEFANSFNVLNNQKELNSYKERSLSTEKTQLNRRDNKSDLLSLSLIEPNQLLETVKGTVVDIYGNILDLNRDIIKIPPLSGVRDNPDVFNEIKKQERKSIAYHFELNAKKDLQNPPDVLSKDNYARDRSRLFFDIDKEGLVKMNIPASSETGNIPIPTRYENYSTVNPNADTNDPSDIHPNEDKVDVLIEPFSNFANIKLKDSSGVAGPKDRFSLTSDNISYGTVHHDITAKFKNFTLPALEYVETTTVYSPKYFFDSLVSKEITIDGANANAGGRSLGLNFDGSIATNIGANTIDRQSVWIDTAGSIVGLIGRDKNDVSMGMSMDGDFLLEIGSDTVQNDSRFSKQVNTHRAGALDIRVVNKNSGEFTILRIDESGVSVSTPARIVFSSNQNMYFKSNSDMYFDAENIHFHGRVIKKGTLTEI